MLPRAAFHLIEQQHGVVARFQLLRHRPPTVVDDLLRGGWFERLERGVFRLRGSPPSGEQGAFAAGLRARPGATITGPLVLGLLSVPGFDLSSPFEILTRPGREVTGVDFPTRTDPRPDRAVTRYGDVRVAAPVDGLIDAARTLGEHDPRALRVAWDHLRFQLGVRTERLERRLADLPLHDVGARMLEEVLAEGGGLAVEGEGERELAPILACFEPPFEPQVWVTPWRRVDFYCARVRYGYEYAGKVDHAHIAARIADDERDAELRREGIRLGYVTASDVREPQTLLATIAGTLTARAHELGVRPPVAVHPLADA